MPGKVKKALRTSYSSATEAIRAFATFFNTHEHPPYSNPMAAVGTNTTLDDSTHTVSVTTTGLTITLPLCSNDRIGQDWTVHLGVAGVVTIQRNGTDTIYTASSATDTSIQIINMGDSLTFRCLTSSTWGIV